MGFWGIQGQEVLHLQGDLLKAEFKGCRLTPLGPWSLLLGQFALFEKRYPGIFGLDARVKAKVCLLWSWDPWALGIPYTNGFLLSAPQQNAKPENFCWMWVLSMVFSPILLAVEPQIQTWKAHSGQVFGRSWNILYISMINEYIWLFVTYFPNSA